MRSIVTSLSVVLLASAAHADDQHKTLGDGYELVVDNRGLYVVKGKQRARLADAISITKAKLDTAARKVDVEVADYSCASDTKYTWELGHLDARLENWAGYALYKKQDYKAAIPAYRRAVAADPKWKIPALNLASAHNLIGEQDAAMTALAPWLASDPVGTYVSASADPELASLLARPELKAVRAKQPGNVKLDATGRLVSRVAIAADRGLVAVVHAEASWGSSAWGAELELRDLATGKLVASTPIVRWGETSTDCYDDTCSTIEKAAIPVVKQRAARLQQMLNELGFVAPALETGSQIIRTADDKFKTTFATAKLGVVAQNGTARVLRGNTTLATAAVSEHLHAAVYLPDQRAIVLWSGRAGAEGCEGSDPTQIAVVALPKAP